MLRLDLEVADVGIRMKVKSHLSDSSLSPRQRKLDIVTLALSPRTGEIGFLCHGICQLEEPA